MGFGIVTAVQLLLKLITLVYGREFSPESKLRRLELWVERKKTAAAVEAERLQATNRRIDQEPDKAGQDLVDDLNEKFKGEDDR